MIDWYSIRSDDIIILAQIAHAHGWGISQMLASLDELTDDERAAVARILDNAKTLPLHEVYS